MKCPNCGSELRKGLSFCPKCGNVVSKTKNTEPPVPKNQAGQTKKKTSIWKILLGLLFLPITITIIIVKNKQIKPVVKTVLLVILWIFFLVVGVTNSEETASPESEETLPGKTVETPIESEDTSKDADTTENPSDNIAEKSEQTEKDRLSNLKLFVETYNKVAATPITDTFEIDISKGGEYYRTEFRLAAYQNAPALKGSIGAGSIEMINGYYGYYFGLFGTDLRIYAFVDSLDVATDIFESYCKACDPNITQKDFDEFYEYYKLDAGDCRIVIGDISGYVMVRNGGFDIMLDSKPDYFTQ